MNPLRFPHSIAPIPPFEVVKLFARVASICVLVVFSAHGAARMKIDLRLLEETHRGTAAGFFVDLKEQADLSGAAILPTKEEKGRYVFDQLREVATRTQPAVE